MINNNLLPPEYRKGPIKEIIKLLVMIIFIVFIIFCTVYGYFYFTELNSEKEIEGYDERIEETNSELKAITQKVESHEYYDEIRDRFSETGDLSLNALYEEFDFSSFVNEIVKTLDTDVQFFYADINDSGFELKGQAIEYPDAESFYTDFKDKIPDFYKHINVELKDVEVVPTTEEGNLAIKEVVVFTIEGSFDENAEELEAKTDDEQTDEADIDEDEEVTEEMDETEEDSATKGEVDEEVNADE